MGVTKQCVSAVVAVAVLFFPASVKAQAVPSSFADLPNTVRRGQEVIVTDENGRKTKGDILDLSDASITLRVRDRWGSEERRRFDESRITAIRRTDPVWNGLLIGLGAGFAAAEIWTRSECGPPDHDRECTAIVRSIGWLTMIPGGAITGALIDKFTGNKLVYQSARGQTTLRLAPMAGPGGAGFAVSVRFK